MLAQEMGLDDRADKHTFDVRLVSMTFRELLAVSGCAPCIYWLLAAVSSALQILNDALLSRNEYPIVLDTLSEALTLFWRGSGRLG
jgi:hypothetical protein